MKPIEINPVKVMAGKGLTSERKLKAIEFLIAFVETFTDPPLVKIHSSLLRSPYISLGQIEVIEKRMDAISIVEVHEPAKYLIKYWEILLMLYYLIGPKTGHMDQDKIEKFISLRDFFLKFGYLTKKQINLIQILAPKYMKNTIEDSLNQNFETHTRKAEPRSILGDILAKFQPNIIDEIVKRTIRIMAEGDEDPINRLLISFLQVEKTTQKISRAKEEEQTIPQAFLSLSDMRKALAFIV